MSSLPVLFARKSPRYLDGFLGTAREISTVPIVRRPFAAAPVPDLYARTLTRRFEVDPRRHAPRIATRTSYTNLLLGSADFDSAYWTENDVVASDGVSANPENGASDVATMMETATTATHYLSQAIVLADTTHVFSVFVKANGRTSMVLRIQRSGPAFVRATFDLASGTADAVGSTDTGTAGIIPLGDGWFRCWVNSNHGDATSTARIYSDSSSGFLGDITKGLFLWGAQLELGSTPGPYIPTTTVARTISAPDLDLLANPNGLELDCFAWLVDEPDLEVQNSLRATFSRTFARIPAAQTFPASRLFERPNIDNLKSGSTYAVSFDDGETAHLFTSRKSGLTIGTIVLGTIPIDAAARNNEPLTSADTVSVTGQTGTATVYGDDTVAELLTAMQGSAGAGLVSSQVARGRDTYEINITIPDAVFFYAAEATSSGTLVTLGAHTLRISRGPAAVTAADTERPNLDPSLRVINITANAAAVGNRVAFYQGDRVVARSVVMVAATDSISVPLSDVDGKDLVLTHAVFDKDATARVVQGAIRCSARRTQQFYLPGVTASITSAADIVPPTIYTSAQAWFDQLVAYIAAPSNTTFVAIEVSDLDVWQGPILMQETLSLQMADAYRTQAVT